MNENMSAIFVSSCFVIVFQADKVLPDIAEKLSEGEFPRVDIAFVAVLNQKKSLASK